MTWSSLGLSNQVNMLNSRVGWVRCDSHWTAELVEWDVIHLNSRVGWVGCYSLEQQSWLSEMWFTLNSRVGWVRCDSLEQQSWLSEMWFTLNSRVGWVRCYSLEQQSWMNEMWFTLNSRVGWVRCDSRWTAELVEWDVIPQFWRGHALVEVCVSSERHFYSAHPLRCVSLVYSDRSVKKGHTTLHVLWDFENTCLPLVFIYGYRGPIYICIYILYMCPKKTYTQG
jgi:hypothetical protein